MFNHALAEQYKNTSNLENRIYLHQHFSISKKSWAIWVFDHFDLPPNCQILDLGCGLGNLWRLSHDRIGADWQVTLGDFSIGMLTQARGRLSELSHKFHYSVMSAGALPFGAESFDAVVANHMLYHVPDLQQTLEDIWRVLRPGGKLFASTNSTKHMAELGTLMPEGLPFAPVGEVIKGFTLENGADVLRPYFKNIEQYRHEDGLHVTEVQPIVNYALSRLTIFGEKFPDAGTIQNFYDKIAQNMQENSGFIKITKDSGLFICKK